MTDEKRGGTSAHVKPLPRLGRGAGLVPWDATGGRAAGSLAPVEQVQGAQGDRIAKAVVAVAWMYHVCCPVGVLSANAVQASTLTVLPCSGSRTDRDRMTVTPVSRATAARAWQAV